MKSWHVSYRISNFLRHISLVLHIAAGVANREIEGSTTRDGGQNRSDDDALTGECGRRSERSAAHRARDAMRLRNDRGAVIDRSAL